MKYKREIRLLLALFASCAFVFVGISTFKKGTARSRPIVPPYDVFWCAENDDCIVIDQIGCCPCEQGGGQAAITAWHKDDLRRFIKKACRPWDKQVCMQVDTCDKHVESICKDRRCRLVHTAE